MLAMTYGHVYVSHMAFGAKDNQTVKAFLEADSYHGPSMPHRVQPCIAHGYDLAFSLEQQKLAADSGYWPLYRFDPRRIPTGETPLVWTPRRSSRASPSSCGTRRASEWSSSRNRARFKTLLHKAEREVRNRFSIYENLAKLTMTKAGVPAPTAPPATPAPAASPKA